MHAANTEPRPADWAKQVQAACVSQGLQMTPLRLSILAVLGESPARRLRHHRALAKSEGKPIAPPTVYRTLEFFLEHGFLHKIESRNAFAPCEHLGHAHQGVLLLCEKCGRSDEIEDPALARALQETADRMGFRATRRMVELAGFCRECGEEPAEAGS